MLQYSQPLVSVIIPVFNNDEGLIKCLEAMERQTLPKSKYEVIVVDNASDQNPKGIVDSFKQASIAYEKTPGSYVARNKGIEIAKGNILAFTDSDCIPDPYWLEKGVEAFFQHENCGLVAGKISLFFKDPSSPTAVEIFESIEYDFDQYKLLTTEHSCLTANVFTSVDIVKHVGLFDASLKSGGDREWSKRVFKAGYQQVYADDACVYHPARSSLHELYKRVTRIQGGSFDLANDKHSFFKNVKGLAKDLLLAFTPPFRTLFRVWLNEKLSNKSEKIKFILMMLFVRYVCAWERIRLRLGGKARRW